MIPETRRGTIRPADSGDTAVEEGAGARAFGGNGSMMEQGTYRMPPPVPGLEHATHHHGPDVDTLVSETRTRISRLLEVGYEYGNVLIDSDVFLHNNALRKIRLVALYVDLVGSTKLSQMLPSEKLAVLVGSFMQEMANVIAASRGLALKFVGDAVIGYFVAPGNPQMAAGWAVNCGKTMLDVISRGINPVLTEYGYPELRARIGMDYGENTVIIYGGRSRISHADLIGKSMNMAAKIQAAAGPDQILVGRDVYIRLQPSAQKEFGPMDPKNGVLPYGSDPTGKAYRVYVYRGQ